MRLSLIALVLSVAACLASAQDKPAGGKAIDLFDGKTLAGWKVIGCEAEVQDGAIFIKGGNGVVRPEKQYADYILELECKNLKADNWDSGIYLRCKDPAGKRPWPQMWQVNLRKGLEGNVAELKAASQGLYKPGEWNAFKITVIGTTITTEINGKPAYKADGLTEPTGFISLQAEVPGGGQWLFKNIKIQELPAK